MLKAMSISSLNMDPVTNSPIIILKEIEGEQTLPIWIGLLEARPIATLSLEAQKRHEQMERISNVQKLRPNCSLGHMINIQ
jgi:bifunctional DNase/RNase